MHSLGAGTTLENDLEQQALAGDEIAKHLWHNYELVKGYLSKEYYRWVQINCPYYTDHGEQHIQSVIRAASMLLGRYRADHHLPPLDIFLLLSAILWHDVGNVFERSKHAEIIAPMTEEIKNIGFSDPSVQRMVVEIAGAHTRRDGLTGPRSSADCVLLSDATLTTNPQELAAILRFADEVSENRARVSEKMIPQVKVNRPESLVYWQFARCIAAARPDPARQRIVLTIEFPRELATERYICPEECLYLGEASPLGHSPTIPLIDYIMYRLEKMNNERAYCAPLFSSYAKISSIEVRLSLMEGPLPVEGFNVEFSLGDSGLTSTAADVYPDIPVLKEFFRKHDEWTPTSLRRRCTS